MNTKVLLTLMGMSASLLTACNNNQAVEETGASESASVEATAEVTNIRVATESSYRPFSFLDPNGNAIGYEIDLMNALCAQMQAQCEISSQDWDSLIPGLKTQKFDAVIAGMSITPERLEVVDFSDPYFSSGLIFTGKKGQQLDFDTLDGVKVGAQRSTVSSEYLETNYPNADVKLYDTHENAHIDLKNGRVDALLLDKVIGLEWLKSDDNNGDFVQQGDDVSTGNDDMGIAVRKDDALADKFNTALAELKENGQYDEITAEYFGEAALHHDSATAEAVAE